MKRGIKILLWIIGLPTGLCLLVVLLLQGLTVPRVTNRLLHKFVPQAVRADASVERLNLRTLSVFPNVEVELVQPVVTSLGARLSLPATDTLLAADTLRVKISPCAIAVGRIHLRDVLLSRPRLYLAERDGHYNFDILLPDKDDTDTTATRPFVFEWDTVRLTDGAVFLHSDSLQVENLTIDSLQVASGGIYQDSTLSARLNMGLRVADAQVRLTDAVAQLSGSQIDTLAAHAWLSIPHVENLLALVPDTLRQLTIRDNTLSGGICLAASVGAKTPVSDSLYSVVTKWTSPAHDFIPAFVQTVHVQLRIDSLNGGHPRRAIHLDNLSLRAEARYDAQQPDYTYMLLDTLRFAAGRSHIHAHALASYVRKREHIDADCSAKLYLRELSQLFALDQQYRVRGTLRTDIHTRFFLSDLLQRKIYDIHSQTTVRGDDVFIGLRQARTAFFIDSLRMDAMTNTARVSKRTHRRDTALLNANIAFRQVKMHYGRGTKAEMQGARLNLYADDLSDHTVPRLRASVSLNGIDLQQFDTVRLLAQRLRVSASMMPDKKAKFVPATTARISMDSVFFLKPRNGMLLDSVRLNATATPRYRRFIVDRVNRTRTPIPDSEQTTVTLDSLLRLTAVMLQDSAPMDAYLKRFHTKGKVYVRTFGIRHQGDSLRPTVRRMDLTLNDDTLSLNSLRLRVGRSLVSLKGDVYNWRRYLLRGRTLRADLSLTSPRIDLNQLTRALRRQQEKIEQLDSLQMAQNMEALTDSAAFAANVDTVSAEADSTASLIVIPRNLNISFRANVDTIIFSEMRLNDFTGNVRLNQQVLTITKMSTSTKVGKMVMNMSYACRDTTQAAAAAAISMDSVQIGELVEALPELDSVMPMLRSFDGSVSLDAAARLRLNSDMSINMPSINAGAWLRGRDLVLLDGETFSEIAKLLMFSKKTRNNIDSLSVEALVENNEVQIFPFMLTLDKYQVGVGGVQGLDESFNYHISVFKPLHLGLDVYGKDFDHIRFKLGKAQYKSVKKGVGNGRTLLRKEDANVIPELQKSIQNYIQQHNRK
ncbi:MAG: hypothetical protein IJ838_03285 [Paludibacteraceae bacterium]|nr:hypothetical protein [Paludibacteraceae bacterium]